MNQNKGESSSFAQMFEDSLSKPASVPVGERVEGQVSTIGREFVFLDLGTRADGLLSVEEVKKDGEITIQVGDTINVMVTGHRDGAAVCALRIGAGASRERQGDKDAALAAIADAYEVGMPVEGTVKESIKGGFSVHVMGQRAFCPISQIQRGFCDNAEEHLGRSYAFAIIEFDSTGRNLVLSRRKLLDAEAEEIAAAQWETLEVGAVLDGEVTNIKSYGAFVDLGGLEGLVHVSEISHDRVGDPHDVLSVGQKLQVSIKEIDRSKQRISLSIKALAEDPWLAALNELSSGQTHEGRVVRLAPFGAFVEIKKGVEGLLHISEMSKDRRINTPREVMREGDSVPVQILSIDPDRRRISLSMASEDEDSANAEAIRQAAANASKAGLGTFADLFGSKLKK